MKKRGIVLYIVLFFATCLLPNFGQKAKDLLITADSAIRVPLLEASPAQTVIAGTDGWLYYKESLDDYTGTAPLTDRQLFDHAHTMAMFQDYLSLLGARFLYVCAPNKNSIVPEHMPAYAKKSEAPSNWERLHEFLDREGVNYLDLKETLAGWESKAEGMELYLKGDSHWSNEGAAIGADAILDRLDVAHEDMSDKEFTVRKDYVGDLTELVYPAAPMKENQVYYDNMPAFQLLSEATTDNYFDPLVKTQGSGSENAVIYRDSFSNALVPFMAGAFSQATFTRGRPMNITTVSAEAASVVIVERAERFLTHDVGEPPLMSGLPSFVPVDQLREALRETDSKVTIAVSDNDPRFICITGLIDADNLQTDSRIFLDLGDGFLYEAMPTSSEEGEGFTMYLLQDKYPLTQEDAAEVKVLVGEEIPEG